jgi:hypothetical protein
MFYDLEIKESKRNTYANMSMDSFEQPLGVYKRRPGGRATVTASTVKG